MPQWAGNLCLALGRRRSKEEGACLEAGLHAATGVSTRALRGETNEPQSCTCNDMSSVLVRVLL